MRQDREISAAGKHRTGLIDSVRPPTVVECVTSRGATPGKGGSSVKSNADRWMLPHIDQCRWKQSHTQRSHILCPLLRSIRSVEAAEMPARRDALTGLLLSHTLLSATSCVTIYVMHLCMGARPSCNTILSLFLLSLLCSKTGNTLNVLSCIWNMQNISIARVKTRVPSLDEELTGATCKRSWDQTNMLTF